jgi:hypothetical protein
MHRASSTTTVMSCDNSGTWTGPGEHASLPDDLPVHHLRADRRLLALPASSLAAAVRLVFANPTGTPVAAAWPLLHPVASAVGWCRFRTQTTG